MPTLMPWSTVGIGDVDVFSPSLPSLVVYTWYVDDQPESSITHFWRDDNTGMIGHELVLVGPVTFEEALTRAHEEAPKRSVERIHVKHARSSNKARATAKPKQIAKSHAIKSTKRTPLKRETAKRGTRRG